MRKFTLLFLLINLSIGLSNGQTMNCNNFCVLNISLDSINHQLDVTIYNGDTNQVNYPTVYVVDMSNDTIGNKNGLFYYYAQLPGDTLIHRIPTALTSFSTGFVGTVFLRDHYFNNTCSFNYPMNCTVGVNELSLFTNSLNVFPNPATDNIHIEIGQVYNEKAEIKLYDDTGRLVKTYSVNQNTLTINRESLRNGIYLITVETGKQRLMKKLIVE